MNKQKIFQILFILLSILAAGLAGINAAYVLPNPNYGFSVWKIFGGLGFAGFFGWLAVTKKL